MTQITWPSRVVDAGNQGWYLTYDPDRNLVYAAGYRREDLPARSGDELTATRGPLRPVLPITDADEARMRELFAQAGRKTVATLAAALDTVFEQLRDSRGGLGHAGDSFAYAMRAMKAGREGSWEAEALDNVIYFGNELNLTPASGKRPRLGYRDAATLRAEGPSKRVNVAAHHELAAVLTRWVTGPDRYTEVAETLAGIVSSYADDASPGGWAAIADQWLQPGGLARDSFVNCYRLLYSRSAHLDTSLL